MAVVITHIPTIPTSQFLHRSIYPSLSSFSAGAWKTRMATLRSQLAFSSPLSQCTHQPRTLLPAMMVSGAIHHSARSSFIGQPLRLSCSQLAPPPRKKSQKARLCIQMVKPTIQFIQGTDEQTVPDVRLTKSRDGTNGMAIFKFDEPSVFDSSGEVGDITGFYMIDVEGILQSVDVNARFVNGKPAGIEAKYVMRTPRDWDRFMRFMERYANSNGLQFVKS